MIFISISRRPCGHEQKETIQAKDQVEAMEIAKAKQMEICDDCANLHTYLWIVRHGKEATA